MKRSVRTVAIFVAAMVLGWPGASVDAQTGGTGTIRLTIVAPDPGTALVEITRVDAPAPARAVVHGPGDNDVVAVTIPAGTYRVTPRAMLVNGQRYVAKADPLQVRVQAGRVGASRVEYHWSAGVQNLRATSLTTTSVALDWDAQLGEDTTVWRTVGEDPPVRQGQGRQVAVNGSSLVDSGLQPGTTYSYSIFARPGDGAFGRTDGDPVSITVGTVPGGSPPGEAFFVLNPRATILAAGDFVSATPTGDGVRLDLGPGVPTPVPGSVLVLPVTPSLPGGYLGEVTLVSDDGRTVWLIVAPMGAAFDLYKLVVPAFGGPAASAQVAPVPSKEESPPLALQTLDEETQARMSRSGEAQPSAFFQAPIAAAANGVECSLATAVDVNVDVGMSHAGHADVTIDTYGILFVEVPTGVSFDIGYSATLSGTIDVEATGAVECGLPLEDYYQQISVYPVPIGLNVRPEVEVSVSGAGSVTNLGFAATGGFQVDGHLGVSGGNSFDGDVINTGVPTQPTATGTFALGLAIGGSVAFGPGVGTSGAGVVIGVGGELFLLDASVGVKMVDDGGSVSACVELSAATRMGISAALRAWIPGYEADYTVSIDELQGEFPWGGSPWHWPNDCTESDTPTGDVVGAGVTVIDDDVVGSDEQWGRVGGFVPGEGAWILSTGRIEEAVGLPSFFASTGLGRPGDAALTALSGFATNDAAAYSVTVVPNGVTLFVKYAFASEEYPEYVGSQFNDVMAVFVNGQNCALVPGTQLPVSINTINAGSHSQFYVDNTFGAAGYSTTMDGLTTPLVCSVPVTPGVPVTIKIAVADASDDIYDSAVAILDGGIWSE